MMIKQILLMIICIGFLSSEFAAQNSPNPPAAPETKKRRLFASPPTKKPVVTNKTEDARIVSTQETQIAGATDKKVYISKVDINEKPVNSNKSVDEAVYIVENDLTGEAKVSASDEENRSTESAGPKQPDSNVVTSIQTKIQNANNPIGKRKISAGNLTETYNIGVGDVLDIQIFNSNNLKISAGGEDSTLYTVMYDGFIDYPLAGESIRVAGLAHDEIAETLKSKIKLYDDLTVKVDVREFASHRASISGLVERPGTKILRREAVPLFTLLAEAVQLPAANRVIIKRRNQADIVIELDKLSTDALVQADDAVSVISAEKSNFYYIAGAIINAGQKEFHTGMTLMQAILAAGGTSRTANMKVVISRQNKAGLLVSKEFNLKQIKNGKVPDPSLENGDRIEIGD
ncbi:MAG: polysaccharide biosynthesis/export family protein [Pyrinomonadaceae bacterium]|nr:polysaccharide biosynthesis/export family protein [Pyrinomonadaceae bacterium]